MKHLKSSEPHLIYCLGVNRLGTYPLIVTLMSVALWSGSTAAQGSEESAVIGSHEPVGAAAGEDVILPCHLEPPFDVTTLRVEWKFNESFVHVYRSRRDDTALQDKQFKNRTFLFHSEMHTGNISLKLTNVSLTDAGKYTCFVPKLQSQVKRGYINLTVDSVNEDKLKQYPTTEPPNNISKSPSSGTIIAVGLVILALLIAFILVIWKRKQMCPTQDRDGHNRSNTDNTQEQVPLNTTNNTNNMGNAVNAENANKSGQH